MPLFDGYGVLVGTLHSYACDARQNAFHYYHCTVMVRSYKGLYRCIIDLDSKHQKDGVQWKVVEIDASGLKGIEAYPDGWHELPMQEDSGALDYYRSPILSPSSHCVHVLTLPEKCENSFVAPEEVPWKFGTGQDAFRELESLLKQGRRLYIYGEPFRTGKGVHNIHQNQGDPETSRWAPENGPWQDGALLVERADRSLAAFLCKFSTQRFCFDIEKAAILP
jgi:hypothetical protein